MKIAVYTITKNEEQFIARWADSASEADVILVADTGSTDATAKVAAEHGAIVHSIGISPWRFDDARNASLALIPADVDLCIALDADEVLTPGWRAHLEILGTEVTRPRYKYVWSWNADGSEGLTYAGDKIHARHGYRWKHPVHEVLTPSLGFTEVEGWSGLEIHHHPDATKSRGQYAGLLEWAVKEDPSDDRNSYYLGREYSYAGKLDEARTELLRYLSLPKAVWGPERSAAQRILATCEPDRAEYWLLRSASEAPDRREPWVDLARHYHDKARWAECYSSAKRAVSIIDKPLEYICEASAWGSEPYDLAAISAFHLGLPECISLSEIAISLDPENLRLLGNHAYFVERFAVDASTTSD